MRQRGGQGRVRATSVSRSTQTDSDTLEELRDSHDLDQDDGLYLTKEEVTCF